MPVLGEHGACALQRRLTLRAVRLGEQLQSSRGIGFGIHFDGADESVMQSWLGDRFTFQPQAQGDLGQRMAWAFEESFRRDSAATVLMGADCPELSPGLIAEAFDALRQAPVVFGPALDGGYYLVGLRRPMAELFRGPAWGTSTVLAESVKILNRSGTNPILLRPLPDVDRPEDLQRWRELAAAEEKGLTKISVVIPALNEAASIVPTIKAAAMGNPDQIVVVDGGSRDGTTNLAREAGATVLHSRPGRGRQMNAGASYCTGNVLLFLHADTALPPDYSGPVVSCLADNKVSCGAFRFAIAGRFAGRRLVEWSTNIRSRWLQMPYGDQGLFLRRALFEELGGFVDWPILEDYELGQRLRRVGRVKTVAKRAVTSGRRWQRAGFLRTTWINKRVIMGYHRGEPVEELAAIYRGRGSPTG
jgi:hypothetical protein